MEVDSEYIQELINRPGESLAVEIKRWIDPDSVQGMAKIARGAMALNNFNGGYLIIGFDDKTLEPDTENIPSDVRDTFNLDKIQAIVAKYSSTPFEISVEFPERDGQLYPVIAVPPGIKTPVAAKSDLRDDNRTHLIRCDDVYFRSLNSNNTPSTTKATRNDWSKILDICFDNREADIGKFLRRHLSGITPETIRELGLVLSEGTEPELKVEELVGRLLQESKERFEAVVEERGVVLPRVGIWEVGLNLIGEVPPHSANQAFLNLIYANNPRYTGWPLWLDSQGFGDDTTDPRPFVIDNVWEALIALFGGDMDDLDFLRFDPSGRFYMLRSFQEDMYSSPRGFEPMTVFDFVLPVLRTAEALAVGISFARAMGCDPETTKLAFGFRWSSLKGRELIAWSRDRHISPGRKAYQDEVTSFIEVPLNTPLSALGDFVKQLVKSLFEVFDGFVLGDNIIEELTQNLLERRRV